MVRNKLHWDANDAVGLPKQRNSHQSSPTFLCFESPTALFASQCNLFRTMWLDPANGLLRIRSCENAVLSSQFSVSTLTTPLPPPFTFFFGVCTGANISRSPPFFWQQRIVHDVIGLHDSRCSQISVVSLPLEFGSHGKMRLTSLHDCYGSWHLYICRSLVRSLDLFDSSLFVCEGHFMCCYTEEFYKCK